MIASSCSSHGAVSSWSSLRPRQRPWPQHLQELLRNTHVAMDGLVSHVEGMGERLEHDRQLYEDNQAQARFEVLTLLNVLERLSRSQRYLECCMRDMQEEEDREDINLESKIAKLFTESRENKMARRGECSQAISTLAQHVQKVAHVAETMSRNIKLNGVDHMNSMDVLPPSHPGSIGQNARVTLQQQTPPSDQSDSLNELQFIEQSNPPQNRWKDPVGPMKMTAAPTVSSSNFIDACTPSTEGSPGLIAACGPITPHPSASILPYGPATSVAPLLSRAASPVIQQDIQQPSPIRPPWPSEPSVRGYAENLRPVQDESSCPPQDYLRFVFPHPPRALSPSSSLEATHSREDTPSSLQGTPRSTLPEGAKVHGEFDRQLAAAQCPLSASRSQGSAASQTSRGDYCQPRWRQGPVLPQHSPVSEDSNDYLASSLRSTLAEGSHSSFVSPPSPVDRREAPLPPYSISPACDSQTSRAEDVDTEEISDLRPSSSVASDLSPEAQLALKTIGFLKSYFGGLKRDFRLPSHVELDLGTSTSEVDLAGLNALIVVRAAKIERGERRIRSSMPAGMVGNTSSSVHLHIHRLDELLGLLDGINCGDSAMVKEERKCLVDKVLKEAGKMERWMEMVCVSAAALVEQQGS